MVNGGLIIFTLSVLITPGETGKYHDWQLLAGRRAALRAMTEIGWVVGVVSNQDEVADGYATNRDYLYRMDQTQRLLDVPLDARVCYHRTDARLPDFRDQGGVLRRLPGEAMLTELMLAHPDEARRGVLFVAEPEYAPAAEAAGVDFMHADQFFAMLEKLWLPRYDNNNQKPVRLNSRSSWLLLTNMMVGNPCAEARGIAQPSSCATNSLALSISSGAAFADAIP